MTDRLDRIENLLETAAITLNVTTERLDQVTERLDQVTERLDQVAEQQRKNTTDIDNLLGAISTTDVEVRSLSQGMRSLSQAVAANEQRFNILIQEMRADRRATQQAFQSLLLQLANVNGRVDDLEAAG